MKWLLQLKVWAMGIQLRNKEKRILQLEKYNDYLVLREVYTGGYFDSSSLIYKVLRGC